MTQLLFTLRSSFFAAAVALGVFGPTAQLSAQPPFDGPPPDPLAEALDTNGDGTISAAEIENAAKSLATLDANHDGKLTFEEIVPFGPPDVGPPGFGGPDGGRGGPGRGRVEPQLVKKFDTNANGVLDASERAQARRYLKDNPVARGPGGGRGGPGGRRGGGRRGPGGGRGFGGPGQNGPGQNGPGRNGPGRGGPGRNGPGRGGPPGGAEVETKPGPQVAIADVIVYHDESLYDPSVLRTLFFEFGGESAGDWEQELADFYRTDVEVLAKLTVGGKTYNDVGVAFRGNSSFFTVGEGQKRSLNVSLDALHQDQRLQGYKTLNLLNGHADPSFMREALFSHIAGHYVPAPKVNFTKVVINGRSWGVYVNAQQYNKDFLTDWFGTKRGVRWKVPAGGGGGGSLVYRGDDAQDYAGYQLKSSQAPDAHKNLIALCKALDEVDPANADTELQSILDIDQALWFLALDNVFIDGDGYISRGSDYTLYEHPSKRFYLIPYDSNETFRFAGGGGPGIRIPGARGAELDPLVLVDEPERPIIQKLLSNPRLKARYIAHVRTLAEEWLDWQKISPILTQWRSLLDEEIKSDTRQLYGYEAFANADVGEGGRGMRGAPGLKTFMDERREYLLNHPELQKPAPRISQLTAKVAQPGTVQVTATIVCDMPLGETILHYSDERFPAPLQQVLMHDDGQHNDGDKDDGLFGAEITGLASDKTIRYYVEARSDENTATVAFAPTSSEMGSATLTYSEALEHYLGNALRSRRAPIKSSKRRP